MKAVENILYTLLLILMMLSAFQKEFGLFPETELSGDFKAAEQPHFTWEGWINSTYQNQLDLYLNDNNGFNPSLIRLNNQLDYSLFSYIHADGVVQGKGGQLFEYDYIRAYTGQDYIGEELIDKKMRRLKFLQDHLKDTLDIDLIFVLEPGKASFYPEFIPDKYLKRKNLVTNYSSILRKANEYDISLVDLNVWFTQLKEKAEYPMYGQYGTHWSLYGMSHAADSLLNLIEDTRGIQLRKAGIDTFLVEETARTPDYDMASAMNLLFKLKDKVPLAYPEYRFEERQENMDYPMVLVVGDSYYWNIFNTGIPKEIFANEAFWYFGNLVYPDYYFQPTFVDDLDIQTEVEKQDVILLMTTERFLYKFDWKLIDELYSIYGATSAFNKTYDYACQITRNDEWFERVSIKAARKDIPLYEMLHIDAKYIYGEQEPLNYAVYYGVNETEERIRSDKDWLNNVAQKARERNTTLDLMIREDAEYILSESSPEAYTIYVQIRDNMQTILNDSLLKNQTYRDAIYYHIDFDEMLFIKAEKMIEQSSRE